MGCLVLMFLYLLARNVRIRGFAEDHFCKGRGRVKLALSALLCFTPNNVVFRSPAMFVLCYMRVIVVPKRGTHSSARSTKFCNIRLKPVGFIVTVFTGAPLCTIAANSQRARRINRIFASGPSLSRGVFSLVIREWGTRVNCSGKFDFHANGETTAAAVTCEFLRNSRRRNLRVGMFSGLCLV